MNCRLQAAASVENIESQMKEKMSSAYNTTHVHSSRDVITKVCYLPKLATKVLAELANSWIPLYTYN